MHLYISSIEKKTYRKKVDLRTKELPLYLSSRGLELGLTRIAAKRQHR